jgi:hypothetical protein
MSDEREGILLPNDTNTIKIGVSQPELQVKDQRS